MNEIYKNPEYSSKERTQDLLSRMTVEEKVAQMMQLNGLENPDPWVKEKSIGSFLHTLGSETERLQRLAAETRLGIPIIFGIDAIHGHAYYDGGTVFPTQLALSSSWNKELLEEVARITAKEVALTGAHWTFSPLFCLGRDPRWGRINETFGEDPYLTGELGSAMIKGYQGEDISSPYSILACAKHFAAYGETQGGRDSSEADVSERKLRSIFFPPFKAAVDAGCTTFMIGYHSIDGVPSSANPWLIKDVLKGEWKFDGFAVTDWNNIGQMVANQKVAADMNKACELAINAGNDMMMYTPEFYEEAVKLVKEGRIPESALDEACSRILELKFRLGLFDHKRFTDTSDPDKVIRCEEHKKAAFESAQQSIVLLKNENNVLPLSKNIKKLAVIGPNADDIRAQVGDWTYVNVKFPILKKLEDIAPGHLEEIVTVLKGIRNRAGSDIEVVYEKGCDILEPDVEGISAAVESAKSCDAVIAVIGDTFLLNGEVYDRATLDLTGTQQELLEALKATGKPLIAVLINGKPLTIPWVKDNADAIVEAWNPGLKGGDAVASVLFGDYNPCGKLTISFPRHVGQIPVYYNQIPGWHADRYCDMTAEPLFHFGYGLSYTGYSYSNLTLSASEISKNGELTVAVDVENTGSIKGTEIVQLYINDVFSSVTTPVKELKDFARTELAPGEKKTVSFKVSAPSLALTNSRCQQVIEEGDFEIMVGASSRDEDLLKATFRII